MRALYFNPLFISKKIILRFIELIPYFKFIIDTRYTQTPITVKNWYNQKIKGINRDAYWPVNTNSIVNGARNIYCC